MHDALMAEVRVEDVDEVLPEYMTRRVPVYSCTLDRKPGPVLVPPAPVGKGIGELRGMLMRWWLWEPGVIPAALAAGIAALAIATSEGIVAKTAAVIVTTIAVQGLTTGFIARRLGLAGARSVLHESG